MTNPNGNGKDSATRVAVIGLGEAGATIHLPALAHVRNAVVGGAADPVEARRNTAARDFAIPVFADVSRLLATTQPDLVIVASPPALHAEHCMDAIDAGADVLCEKPFAASVFEARKILEHAAVRERRVSVNHEFRAMPIFRDLIAAVRNDPRGPAVVQVWQAVSHSPDSERGWRGNLKRRSLYEAGVHLVDLALQLFGETPHGVSASFASAFGSSSDADAIVLVSLRFSGDRLAQLVQRRVHRGDRQYLEVRADTRDASYRASFGGRARFSVGFVRSSRPHFAVERGGSGIAWKEQGAERTIFSRNSSRPLVVATTDVIQSCVAAVRENKQVAFPASDGVETLRVIAAAYASAAIGRTVDIDGDDATELMSLTESRTAEE